MVGKTSLSKTLVFYIGNTHTKYKFTITQYIQVVMGTHRFVRDKYSFNMVRGQLAINTTHGAKLKEGGRPETWV